jgi:hypothetical protein
MASGSPTPPAEERIPFVEGAIAPIRRYGMRSFLVAISAVGVLAGILSASAITLALWKYLVITAATYLAVLLAFTLSSPRYKFWLFSLFYRRPRGQTPEGGLSWRHVVGISAGAPVRQVAAGRKVDRIYEGGFRALLDAENPVAIIASSPRDVSDPNALPGGMWGRGATRTECVVDPSVFGIPLERYSFERHMTEGAVGRQDIDHMLAVKDIVYLPELAQALRPEGLAGEPFMWPEHTVDMPFLASHDIVVVGAGDSNFWHAALFEPVRQSFLNPPSTIPLALDLRDSGDSPISFYGSRQINVALASKQRIPGLEKARRFELDERRFPTCAMLLAVENPFARALQRSHWCVFVSGMRSLGGSGAVLALAVMVDRMRRDPELNYCSLVETAEPNVHAKVSALLVRTTEVEYAAEAPQGKSAPRGQREVPTDRPDPDYRDSYMAVGVEYLDNLGETPVWRPLVSLRSTPPAAVELETAREVTAAGV